MDDCREAQQPDDADIQGELVYFRLLDLRARRSMAYGEHMRPYCVLRLGDQHHRTQTFLPDGFNVRARRATVDDRQLSGRWLWPPDSK